MAALGGGGGRGRGRGGGGDNVGARGGGRGGGDNVDEDHPPVAKRRRIGSLNNPAQPERYLRYMGPPSPPHPTGALSDSDLTFMDVGRIINRLRVYRIFSYGERVLEDQLWAWCEPFIGNYERFLDAVSRMDRFNSDGYEVQRMNSVAGKFYWLIPSPDGAGDIDHVDD